MKSHLLMPTSKRVVCGGSTARESQEQGGGIITCHLLDWLCQYAAANVSHLNTCTNWDTISCLYEDSWPDAPNTAKSCAFRSGDHSYKLIYMQNMKMIRRFIKFHPSLKGSFKVEPAFPIHVQAWGIILIAILIATLPLKSSDTFERNIRYSPLLSLSLLQMGISLTCPLLSRLRLHTAS